MTSPATTKSTSSLGSPVSGVESGAAALALRLANAARIHGRWETVISVIAHQQSLVAESDGCTEHEENDTDGRAEADPHPSDAEVIEERDDGVGRVQRPAAGQ